MKKDIKDKVLNFMIERETKNMNTNEFVITFLKDIIHNAGNTSLWLEKIQTSYSFESILRARRHVIADHGIGKRTKADKESVYVEEFARTNKY